MMRFVNIMRPVLIVLVVWTISSEAGRKNRNTLDWDPKKPVSDSIKFGSIIPDGDVYIAAVDSAELKLNGYHVTNDVEDELYYGELRLPEGHHTLIVYSIKPMEKRSIDAERGVAKVPSGYGNTEGAGGGSKSDLHVVTKGGSGSKMLLLAIDVSAGEQYVIRAGKTTDDWKVISGSTGKKIDVIFVSVFPSDD